MNGFPPSLRRLFSFTVVARVVEAEIDFVAQVFWILCMETMTERCGSVRSWLESR